MSHKGCAVSAAAAREFEQGRLQVPLTSITARDALEPGQPLRVLDPPTFSTARGASFSIERDYAPLIAAAAAVVSPGGVLWLACNTREILLTAIAQVGLQRAGREAQFQETGGLPPDYPTVLGHPEDRYLQVGVFRIV